MVDAIVFLSLAFGAIFFVAWLSRPGLRAWLERPKYRFQKNVQSYDLAQQAGSDPKDRRESL